MGFRLRKSIKGEEGFTLVELLISMLVSVVVLAAVSATFIIQNKSYNTQEQVIDAQEHARAAIQIMMKELLMAGYDPTGKANAGILLADSDEVRFTMDLDGNQSASGSGEDITYALDTSEKQVTRETGGSGQQPIAENIQALAFTYFDSDGNELTSVPLSSADREKVTRVSVEVTPIMPQSAGYNHEKDGENLILLARNGAHQAWTYVTEVITPSAHATSDRALKDSVTPPNLGKTKTGAEAGLGSGGTGYETAQDETWEDESSSSSS
jgi:prepilin-type N-terminal cleavage/methylation domain-containing protein